MVYSSGLYIRVFEIKYLYGSHIILSMAILPWNPLPSSLYGRVLFINFESKMESKMGCDIHLHIEVKINDKWEHFSEFDMLRNYELFSFLVTDHPRNDYGIKGISNARGLPEDVNGLTRYILSYSDDLHTHSFLTLKEIFEFKGNSYSLGEACIKTPVLDKFSNDDIRIVFGFDS